MARAEGVSTDSLVSSILSQRLAVAEADSYIRSRGNRGSAEKMLQILSQAPQIEPDVEDKR